MRNQILFLLIAAMFLSLTGCGGKGGKMRVNSTPLTCPEGTPPGVSCLMDIGGTSTAGDGTILRIAYQVGGDCWYKVKDEATGQILDTKAPCGKEALAIKYVDDRGNTVLKAMGGAAVSAVGDVLSARQIRLGRENAAEASSKAGPGMVIVNENKPISSSGSMAGSSTQVGITQTETSCPSGDCFKPPGM